MTKWRVVAKETRSLPDGIRGDWSQAVTVTHLRQRLLDELQGRNCSQSTSRCYIYAVEGLASHLHRLQDRPNAEKYLPVSAVLFSERFLQKLSKPALRRCPFCSSRRSAGSLTNHILDHVEPIVAGHADQSTQDPHEF